MFIGAISESLMAIVIKFVFLNTPFSVAQVMIFRSFFCAICSLLLAFREGVDPIAIPRREYGRLLMRAFLGSAASVGQIASLNLLPISLATAIFWTQPIFAALIACIFNGESFNGIQAISVGAAMFGVFLLTNPQFFQSSSSV